MTGYEISLLVGSLAWSTIQIIIVIKFFQLTSDVKKIKIQLGVFTSQKNVSCPVVEKLLEDANIENYIGNYSKEKEYLLRAKYRLDKGNSKVYTKTGILITQKTISNIESRILEIKN